MVAVSSMLSGSRAAVTVMVREVFQSAVLKVKAPETVTTPTGPLTSGATVTSPAGSVARTTV